MRIISEPQKLVFQLINTNTDYIEFVVSYVIKEDKWRIDGIGWIQEGNPTYYLRRLRLDGVPANAAVYAKKALLMKKKMSYRFNCSSLDELTLFNIAHIFTSTKSSGNTSKAAPPKNPV